MARPVQITLKGKDGLMAALKRILKRIPDKHLLTKELADNMREVVHVRTGYLKSTIYNNADTAGAGARYAGFEARRGGNHDFANLAVERTTGKRYFDYIVDGY